MINVSCTDSWEYAAVVQCLLIISEGMEVLTGKIKDQLSIICYQRVYDLLPPSIDSDGSSRGRARGQSDHTETEGSV